MLRRFQPARKISKNLLWILFPKSNFAFQERLKRFSGFLWHWRQRTGKPSDRTEHFPIQLKTLNAGVAKIFFKAWASTFSACQKNIKIFALNTFSEINFWVSKKVKTFLWLLVALTPKNWESEWPRRTISYSTNNFKCRCRENILQGFCFHVFSLLEKYQKIWSEYFFRNQIFRFKKGLNVFLASCDLDAKELGNRVTAPNNSQFN